VTDTGVVKLSDFGVAKILTRIEDCRSTSGTHGYMVSVMRIFGSLWSVCLVHRIQLSFPVCSTLPPGA